MVLLSESNPRPPICVDCHRPAEMGDDRCGKHRMDLAYWQSLVDARRFPCPRCGTPHHGIHGRKFCTRECGNAFYAADAMAFVAAAQEQLDLGPATGMLRRLFEVLRDRDGDECYLCTEPVDIDLKDYRWGPSVDHVIPRSGGGTHDLANLALTHRRCNSAKGARPAEAESQRLRKRTI